MQFIKEQVEIEPGKTFFNILRLKNKTDKTQTFNIQFNTPRNWNFIGDKLEKITLKPFEEQSIPVRVTLSHNTNGGVGYAVVAMILHEDGSIYNSVNAFVKIPVISNISIKTDNRSIFFSQESLKSKFSVSLNNKGNVDEVINIGIKTDKSLTVSKNNEPVTTDNIEVKSGKTVKLEYNVKLNPETDFKKYSIHKIKLQFKKRDSLIEKSIWFNYVDWQYRNINPDSKNPLNIELVASNIFGGGKPYYYGRIYGNILLKGKKELYYSFRTYRRDQSNNYWINSHNQLEYRAEKTILFLGDYTGNLERSMYGRGVAITQKIGKKTTLKAIYTKRLQQEDNNYGLLYAQNFNKFLSSELGGVFINNTQYRADNKLIFGKINTSFTNNRFSLLFGKSFSTLSQYTDNKYQGWGLRSELNGRYKKITYRLKSDYGSPHYIGYLQGILNARGEVNFNVLKNKNISLNYNIYRHQPAYVLNNTLISDRHTTVQKLIPAISFIKNRTQLQIKAFFEKANTNSFAGINPNDNFSSYSSHLELNLRKADKYIDYTINLSLKYGLTSIYQYPLLLNGVSYEGKTGDNNYTTGQIRGGIKYKHIGLSASYYLGPYNISQQFAYFYTYVYSKSLMIIPYYENSFFNNKIKVSIYASYINNLASKGSRGMISPKIEWFPGKGFSMYLLNSSSINSVTENSSLYTTSYFEFGISKSFRFQQPRIKFYNYHAVFYKDLNGNRMQDENEPGVADVLAEIERANPEADIKNKNYNGDFLPNRLYSNENGDIRYENLAEGEYIIKFIPKGKHDRQFDAEESIKRFKATKDTVMHIPFVERNKLFGQITLHRTKHSALGEIPLDNIKIIVEGNDKTYSTLTDETGSFEMYIPVSDYYKVKVSNIFQEHFTLRKESYIVKFNGYKQFELSFDFDEKERQINFDENDFLLSDDDEEDLDDIKVIKQTNLRGVIKDANSLLPLHATVSIINNKTNELISETASSRRTGVYFTSFFAGNSHTIKAEAKGYWAYSDELYIDQVTAFNNINRDVLLNKIYIDEEIKTVNLNFKEESAELSLLAEAELNTILQKLFANPDVIIEIGGHVDDMEALTLNGMELSRTRAENVADYLFSKGLSKKRVKIKAWANSNSKSREDGAAGRAQNRRVTFNVIGF